MEMFWVRATTNLGCIRFYMGKIWDALTNVWVKKKEKQAIKSVCVVEDIMHCKCESQGPIRMDILCKIYTICISLKILLLIYLFVFYLCTCN